MDTKQSLIEIQASAEATWNVCSKHYQEKIDMLVGQILDMRKFIESIAELEIKKVDDPKTKLIVLIEIARMKLEKMR